MKTEITATQARELLDYDPSTGVFAWSLSPANRSKAGRRVGTIAKNGYVMIAILGKTRLAHRLAWLITFGRFPEYGIDHINQVKTDNRIVNLRDAPQSVNSKNHPLNPRLVGALRDENGGWTRTIIEYGKEQVAAGFKSPEEANKAYLKDQKRVGNPYAREPKLRLPAIRR